MITPIHENMKRCLLTEAGVRTAYLDPDDSHNLEGVAPSITGVTEAGTTGLTIKSTGDFATGVVAGQWVKNLATGYYHEIASVDDADTLTVYPQMGSVGTKWGLTTATTVNTLADSGAIL